MSFTEKAIQSMAGNQTDKMHTGFPANVLSYDEGAHTATIQPLFNYDDGSAYPQAQMVPVAVIRIKQIHMHAEPQTQVGGAGDAAHSHGITIIEEEVEREYPLFLKSGDCVWCAVSEKSTDAIASKQVHTPQSKRKFDATDAIITSILYPA